MKTQMRYVRERPAKERPPRPITPLASGTVIAKGHRIEEVLGSGGFGITYKVRRPQGGFLAMKEYCPRDSASRKRNSIVPLPRRKTDFQSGYDYFRNEAETLRRLPEHPNIVRVEALFEKFGTIYMLMEYIEGLPLSDVIRQGGLPQNEGLRDFLGESASALWFLHDHNVMHADIKPQNIMIRPDSNQPVLIDFGAVRDLSKPDQKVEILTEGYAPIEMAQQRLDQMGPWSDIFSLGMVGYFLATGKRPVPAQARAKKLLKGEPDPMTPCVDARRPEIEDGLARVIDACTAFDPTERPLSGEMLIGLLTGDRTRRASRGAFGQPTRLVPEQIAQSIEVIHFQVVTPAQPEARPIETQWEELPEIPPDRLVAEPVPQSRSRSSRARFSAKLVAALVLAFFACIVGAVIYASATS